jgi:hypothetical protein
MSHRKSSIFEKKRASDTDKVRQNQGDELRTQVKNIGIIFLKMKGFNSKI